MNRSIAIVCVVFIAWSSAALGQPAGAQPEMLFRQGRDLFAAGKVAEACSAFEESQALELALVFAVRDALRSGHLYLAEVDCLPPGMNPRLQAKPLDPARAQSSAQVSP